MSNYAIYVDLSRLLSDQERSEVFEALDVIVPGSGCVGVQHGPTDELYFCVDAVSETEAKAVTDRYMRRIIDRAGLDVEFEIGYISQDKAL